MSEVKKKIGAPTKYHEGWPNMVRKYASQPMFEYEEEERMSASGDVKTIKIKVPGYFPTVAGFCADHDIHKDTFYEWVKKHPNFADSHQYLKARQEKYLVTNGLKNLTNASITRVLLNSCAGIRESQEHKVDGNILVTSPSDKVKDL